MPPPPSPANGHFELACARFDAANGVDPNRERDLETGEEHPRELVYARWLTAWVARLAPGASEALRLAARCQHLRRWEIPRESFPAGRAGYLQWRERLKRFHADEAETILREAGYGDETTARVRALNLKRDLSHDPECQILEDALCLVFIQYQLATFAAKTDPDKVVAILQKSWKKMSPAGRDAAAGIDLPEPAAGLLARATG